MADHGFHGRSDRAFGSDGDRQVRRDHGGLHLLRGAPGLNGDPGTHHLWAEIPNIEDQQWHDVEINVNGASVLVLLDGAVVIDGQIDGLNFKGGYIGFSGTTGFYTNFHRIDDLQVREYCGPR